MLLGRTACSVAHSDLWVNLLTYTLLSLCKMMDLKLSGNGLLTLPRLTGSSNCISKIITDVFSPWYHVNRQSNAPNKQNFFLLCPNTKTLELNWCTYLLRIEDGCYIWVSEAAPNRNCLNAAFFSNE